MKQCMNFKFVILFALTLLVGSTVYGQDNVIDVPFGNRLHTPLLVV